MCCRCVCVCVQNIILNCFDKYSPHDNRRHVLCTFDPEGTYDQSNNIAFRLYTDHNNFRMDRNRKWMEIQYTKALQMTSFEKLINKLFRKSLNIQPPYHSLSQYQKIIACLYGPNSASIWIFGLWSKIIFSW